MSALGVCLALLFGAVAVTSGVSLLVEEFRAARHRRAIRRRRYGTYRP